MITADKNGVTHYIHLDTDYPAMELSCSCGEWNKRLPAIGATEEAMAAAAEEHRLAVFGPKPTEE